MASGLLSVALLGLAGWFGTGRPRRWGDVAMWLCIVLGVLAFGFAAAIQKHDPGSSPPVAQHSAGGGDG